MGIDALGSVTVVASLRSRDEEEDVEAEEVVVESVVVVESSATATPARRASTSDHRMMNREMRVEVDEYTGTRKLDRRKRVRGQELIQGNFFTLSRSVGIPRESLFSGLQGLVEPKLVSYSSLR